MRVVFSSILRCSPNFYFFFDDSILTWVELLIDTSTLYKCIYICLKNNFLNLLRSCINDSVRRIRKVRKKNESLTANITVYSTIPIRRGVGDWLVVSKITFWSVSWRSSMKNSEDWKMKKKKTQLTESHFALIGVLKRIRESTINTSWPTAQLIFDRFPRTNDLQSFEQHVRSFPTANQISYDDNYSLWLDCLYDDDDYQNLH